MDQAAVQSAPQTRILVVDDDAGIRSVVCESLAAYGYVVRQAASAAEMDRVLAREPVHLIILDVMMPGEDGLSACRRLAGSGGPLVIILSALGQEMDRVVGLELGADHYLAKPCSPRELLAHVRAVLRRLDEPRWSDSSRHRVFRFLGWQIDLDSHELIDAQGVLVHLSDGEFSVLRAFVQRPRRVLSREELLDAARGRDSDAFDRAIDVQVSRLRRKLKASENDLIRTVRNEGYMFVPRVTLA